MTGPGDMVAPLRVAGSPMDQLQQSRLSADLPVRATGWTVGVCACHSGAGATTVAQNIAVMLHERGGEPVVLVEGNLRSPSLAERSHVATDRGFTEFALGDDYTSTIVPDAVHRGVSLMAASGEGPVQFALLRHAAARLPSLHDGFRHVLVDLPPVLDFPDAILLGAALDGVVLVIEAEATDRDAARRAKKRLEAGGVKLLGSVLNKKPQVVPDWVARRL